MQLTGSYRQILRLSIPIMLGSAAQQVITLSDSIFLYDRPEDFAAIGFAGMFYLVVAAIGYGFSKGGQIMIARRDGEGESSAVGENFRAMLAFELLLALLLFGFMRWGCPWLFDLALQSDVILEKSLQYLDYRSYGVFFSYVGLSFISLYTGVARTNFILIVTTVLGLVNIILNYSLINGLWGLPEMGIAGAGLASTIAEVVAFFLFLAYILLDKGARAYRLWAFANVNTPLIVQQAKLAAPIVAQTVLGLGSWVVFFSIIENLGERELGKANLVRMVYLFLSIPTWGFSSGINTLVSNCIGQGRQDMILQVTRKTALLTLGVTLLLTLPFLIDPEYVLSFIFSITGESYDSSLIHESHSIFYVLAGVLLVFTFGGIYFNALSGAGATLYGLRMQAFCVLLYLSCIYICVNFLQLGQPWAWSMEIIYWGAMLAASYWYLQSGRWRKLEL